METLSHPPTSISAHALIETVYDGASPQTFLKMEDLHSGCPSESTAPIHLLQNSPPPAVIVHSKPAKKRKSWGQELPEPKTNLPPRKRAKTDDEKEQRRIERIKRNRAAAHNSRERKRQETETLAVALARANAELEAYRQLHGPLPASVVLPEVTLSTDCPDTPTPSLVESHGSADHCASPESPSLPTEALIKQESIDSSLLGIPSVFSLDAKSASCHSPLDLTQHSAAMLCDLQCRSSGLSHGLTSASSTCLAPLFLYLTILQFRTCYQTLLIAIWSLSPSRMARWTQVSTRRSISPLTISSKIQLLLRSMALAQHKAATHQPTSQGAFLALRLHLEMRLANHKLENGAELQRSMYQRKAFPRRNFNGSKAEDNGLSENWEGV